MKIVRVKDLEGTDRDVEFNAGRSVRILLEKDIKEENLAANENGKANLEDEEEI